MPRGVTAGATGTTVLSFVGKRPTAFLRGPCHCASPAAVEEASCCTPVSPAPGALDFGHSTGVPRTPAQLPEASQTSSAVDAAGLGTSCQPAQALQEAGTGEQERASGRLARPTPRGMTPAALPSIASLSAPRAPCPGHRRLLG